MKHLFGVSTVIFILILFSLQIGVTSCTKETIIHDTVKVTKHDTTILIHKDTIKVPSKDTVFAINVNAWNCFSTASNTYLSPGPTTFLNTTDGIQFFPQATRTGVRLETKTEVGFKDKVIYYKWKVNGGGQFADYAPQVKYDPLTGDGNPPIQGVDFAEFSVVNSTNNSTLIQNDIWYYTRVKAISGSDIYQVITSTNNYDNNGGTVLLAQNISIYTKNGYLGIRIGDEFTTNAYCILGECKIVSN